jgi:DNA-binding NtrC family response regulator
MEQVPGSDLKTILIVDDDPRIVAVVMALLANSEYKILTAENGSKALEESRAFSGDIHVLLSDFQMPGISGIDLAMAMTAERPEVKVLLMSGYDGGMLVLNAGWHFLAKPFIASQLRALITGLAFPERRSAKFSR